MHSLARTNLQQFINSYKEPNKQNGWGPVEVREGDLNGSAFSDAKINHEAIKEANQVSGIKKLEEVKNKRVSFAAKALSDFNGCLDNDVPVPGKAISFLTGQFLHIYEKFNNDWWIGRLVSDGSPVLGFIPTPSKFHQIKSHRHKILQRTIKQRNSFMSSSKKKGLNKEGEVELHEQASYYDIVPCMRPVCLIGPSLKGFNVTDLLQKAVLEYLKDYFKERAIVCKMTQDSINPSDNKFYGEAEYIFEKTKKMKLVFLENGNTENPAQLRNSILAPIIIYIRIENLKILRKLMKSSETCSLAQTKTQMQYAQRLLRFGEEDFDLVVKDNQLDKVCQRCVQYLENYWRSTHPKWP